MLLPRGAGVCACPALKTTLSPSCSFTANFGISWHSGPAVGEIVVRNNSYQQLCLGKAAVWCVTVPETPGTRDGGGIPGAEQWDML